MIRRPPRSTRTDTLFPYTTLFRSRAFVSRTFRNAFRIAGMGSDDSDDAPPSQAEPPCADLNDHIQQRTGEQAQAISRRVEAFLDSHRIRSLSGTSRKRVEALLPVIVDMAARTETPETTDAKILALDRKSTRLNSST